MLASAPYLLGQSTRTLNMGARPYPSLWTIPFSFAFLLLSAQVSVAQGQVTPTRTAGEQVCPRESEGSRIREPVDLRSEGGVLRVHIAFEDVREPDGQVRFCYVYGKGIQSPTLRVHPGDTLILTLKNEAKILTNATHEFSSQTGMSKNHVGPKSSSDPCAGGAMTEATTNLHFHGMVVPPTCHQDETIKTLIQPNSVPFEYKLQIPKDEIPGLYWYHPHPHGFTEEQVLGGASGALVVEGIEKIDRAVSGLPERVLVIRDQLMAHPSLPSQNDPNKPTKDLSLNYVPIRYPELTPAVIETRPHQKEFWRVLNASADTFVDLGIVSDGKNQLIGVVAMDGVPEGYDEGNAQDNVVWKTHVLLPPAGRAEFIVTTPSINADSKLITHAVPRGPMFDPDRMGPVGTLPGQADQDDNDPTRTLAVIRTSAKAPQLHSFLPKSRRILEKSQGASLASTRPVRTRRFYFSEELEDPKNPRGPSYFYITEEGHKPKVFNPNDPPSVIVHQGDVEDWIVENRSNEPHTFHIHQLHFLVIERNGGPYEDVTLRDTINIPYWNGFTKPYPSVKLRMDFRSPYIIGTFPYHCHILQHEDAGMMGTVRVEPLQKKKLKKE